jgi:hypothetical protein
MFNIVYLATISSINHDEYEIEIIDDGERLWLKLSDTHSGNVLRCWSTKPNQGQTPSYILLIDMLRDRLANVGKRHKDIYDALQFWPSGWDYWGGGIPVHLDSYLSSEEHLLQLRKMKSESAANEK